MTGPRSRFNRSDNLALLSTLGLLPSDCGGEFPGVSALSELAKAGGGTAIEQALLELWTEWRRTAPRRQRPRATKVAAWLQSVVDGGGSFALGNPGEAGRRLSDLCGERVLFWPHGRPSNSLAAITSSRIGRSDAAVAAFVETLRFVLPRVAEARQTVLVVEETAGADLVHRAARQASIPVLLGTASADRHPERWLSSLMQTDPAAVANEARVFVSPAIPVEASASAGVGNGSIAAGSAEDLPLRDRVAVALAETVWNLSVRKGGNLHRLLQWRLQQDGADAASVRLVVPGEEPLPNHLVTLVDRGAIPWQLLKSTGSEPLSPTGESLATEELSEPAVLESIAATQSKAEDQTDLLEQLSVEGEWLIHWTRMMTRPHAGQSSVEWLDRQLQSSSDDPSGPLASLQQILQDGNIRASADGLRGSMPMTCFSAVPLRELVSRRRFQTHRARWDFEPYGLCLRRRTLEILGTRPVIYGDEALWQAMPEPERPWFQKRFSGRGDRQIDWSEELEWRIAGDVVLGQFARKDLVVFCRQAEDVAQLAPFSAWPVIALADLV